MWREEIISRCLGDLERQLTEEGKRQHFEIFREFFLSEPQPSYDDIGARVGLSRSDISNRLVFVKNRYRDVLRRIVLETVTRPDELEEELGWLLGGERR